jgi:hypothetical protein
MLSGNSWLTAKLGMMAMTTQPQHLLLPLLQQVSYLLNRRL